MTGFHQRMFVHAKRARKSPKNVRIRASFPVSDARELLAALDSVEPTDLTDVERLFLKHLKTALHDMDRWDMENLPL